MKKCRMAGTVMLAGALIGACSLPQQEKAGTAQETEGPVLTLFDKNSERHLFNDRIAEEIMRRTGVRIEVVDSTDNVEEQEELMYARQDYPDMIKVDLEAIYKYQDAGYLQDLEPYLEQLPNVRQMYGEEMLRKMRSPEGELYYLGNWYGEDLDAVNGFQIRYDYLVSLVGRERADSDEPFTQEEFLALLRAFAAKYPEVKGGKAIPFTTCLEYDSSGTLQGMYGMKAYWEQDGRLSHLVRDPAYVKMLAFLNEMYREKLLDKEWVLNREQLFADKLKSGRVFAVACAYWDLSDINASLREQEGKDAYFACYKVLGEGITPDQTTYGGRNSLGWDAIAVTDRCEDMDAALRVIDFLASEEGQYLMLWGIEGEDWTYEDGVRTPSDENLRLFSADIQAAVEKTGIRRWIWFIKNGTGSDGSPYDMVTKYRPTREAELANRRMDSDYWDTSLYMELDPRSGTEESLMWSDIREIYDRNFPGIVNADSPEKMTELYERMVQDMERAGLYQVEEVWTQNYQKRMERWEE
ncbi:MAG: extracellular solute-binding protein [Eubacteriales bacterium]|nr:extracellular solute-binding protein [Eubacteriales bacterium]